MHESQGHRPDANNDNLRTSLNVDNIRHITVLNACLPVLLIGTPA